MKSVFVEKLWCIQSVNYHAIVQNFNNIPTSMLVISNRIGDSISIYRLHHRKIFVPI